jgi:hypothetical protein
MIPASVRMFEVLPRSLRYGRDDSKKAFQQPVKGRLGGIRSGLRGQRNAHSQDWLCHQGKEKVGRAFRWEPERPDRSRGKRQTRKIRRNKGVKQISRLRSG